MKVIVGLGNPGAEYAETRHNAGFLAVDGYAEQLSIEFRVKFQGQWAEAVGKTGKILLLKPQTYMNLSGRAVRELLQFYKIPCEDLLVVHDDMDLPLGKIRLRERGSAGGHNGIRSLIAELGTENFWRLKIGVGRPSANRDPAQYVLSPFTADELPVVEDVLESSGKVLDLWLNNEAVKAMNIYNR